MVWNFLKMLGICGVSVVFADTFQPIDLNTASEAQIQLLPGIGKRKAEAIIKYREEHGGFRILEDLLKVEGVKPKLLNELKSMLQVSKPSRMKNAPPQPKEPVLNSEELNRLIYHYPGEPTVQAVQEHVIELAGLQSKMVSSWLNRVRYAAWLPKIDAGAERVLDKGTSIRERIGDPNTLYTKDSANWELRAKAEWHLNELLFHPDELRVAQEAVRVSREREHLLERATDLYFERRKLQIAQKVTDKNDVEKWSELMLKEQQLRAQLDGLTGGWFSEQIH